ncbi:EscU/YscU/HrcU family type III secretion system export apparatus switch protein [Methylotenera sp.]|uniref:EscU/YscU/HrcU family type III secretion system export apparatus switch protein n=1 Tax=Methylotenera sp. TaxID=2051956 RepID=UPI002489BCFB|nr:EscU/YscU/HrcU family type III secretion system export apparatus switch protein [Methylotenera sp.]MDI1361359.1 EscU/YscU/HrcU family type III secretion system export apparatus switch protein [Methylotenera sp.]
MSNHQLNTHQPDTIENSSTIENYSSDFNLKGAVNPNQQAIALAYAAGEYAPKVVAKGRGAIAEQIIARAKEHDVFVHESKDLVALLMQVDLDDHIPPALYQAIAEVLAWLYKLEQVKADEEAPVF